jgi:hypothetical protein
LADHGRFAHSILPRVSLRPWFEGQKKDRSFVTSVSRIMSGHSSVRSHLYRFGIVEGPMCVCLQDYETMDHLIWHCERFGSERHRIIDALSELDVHMGLQFRICVVYESEVPSNVFWTSSEVLKSVSDLTDSLSVDVELEKKSFKTRTSFSSRKKKQFLEHILWISVITVNRVIDYFSLILMKGRIFWA